MFLFKAKKDIYIKTFLEKVDRGVYSMDTNLKLKEITSIHAGRIVHTLRKEQLLGTASALGEVMFENQQKRARIVSIKMECVRKMGVLSEKITTLSKYTKTTFVRQLQLEFSTQQQRNEVVDELFSVANSIVASLKTLNDVIDILLNDIDQSAWACSHTVKVISISSDKMHQIG